mmetsp:Transcript_41913/g.89983  ORF Transcript_41913/g.89983 Transcript_41913/m.89983 type:complete len:205 (-) Transcript_41913:176-790(-)
MPVLILLKQNLRSHLDRALPEAPRLLRGQEGQVLYCWWHPQCHHYIHHQQKEGSLVARERVCAPWSRDTVASQTPRRSCPDCLGEVAKRQLGAVSGAHSNSSFARISQPLVGSGSGSACRCSGGFVGRGLLLLLLLHKLLDALLLKKTRLQVLANRRLGRDNGLRIATKMSPPCRETSPDCQLAPFLLRTWWLSLTYLVWILIW